MRKIPALYMRGGTSKGVFFHADDLPDDPRQRDALLLRVIGSPDPYGKHSDGMGGATSSTSKVVVLSRSQRTGIDVEYLFGAVAIDAPLIDWSGNCGNLSAAVGPAALYMGLVPQNGHSDQNFATIRIWQQNIGQLIVARMPILSGLPDEGGNFQEDGVAFGGAEISLEFIESDEPVISLLPTTNIVDVLNVPEFGCIEATLLTAGNPTVFVDACALGLTGRELPDEINANTALLMRCEAIRAHAAVVMGVAECAESATRNRPATPKLAWVSPPASYVSSAGVTIHDDQIDVVGRILSMGKLHHAFTGTGAIALAVAAALPDSVVARNLGTGNEDEKQALIRIGHVSGRLMLGATVRQEGRKWQMEKAILSRSARLIMSGQVHLP
ncbi:2-methylaconitate cis-trans isomerase PrpF [Glaciimonas sp. GG7]